MRFSSSSTRRPLGAALAAVLAVGMVLPGHVAGADPAATRGPDAARPHATLDEALGAAGVSRVDFEVQSDLAARLADASPEFSARFPEAFAGVRVAGRTGEVAVVRSAPGAAELDDAARRLGFSTVDAAVSARELDSRAARVEDWKDTLPPAEAAGVAAAVDPVSGEVEVGLGGTAVSGPDAARAEAATGVRARSTGMRPAQGSLGAGSSGGGGSPVSPAPGGTTPPLDALAGGDLFVATGPGPTDEHRCSLGFNGTLNGRVVNLTAAHCATFGIPPTFAPTTLSTGVGQAPLGTFTAGLTDEKLDVAAVTIDTEDAARFRYGLVRSEGGARLPVTGTQAPVLGQTVCKYGWRSGYTCGPVTSLDAAYTTAGTAFLFQACGLSGDSGGVLFAGSRAVGILTHTNSFTRAGAPYSTCDAARTGLAATGEVPLVQGTTINAALARFPGLAVTTS